jgi:hypothetical protein
MMAERSSSSPTSAAASFAAFLPRLLASLAMLPTIASAQDGDPTVGVQIERTLVALSVFQRFDEIAGSLPPGEITVTDEHELAHGARTYCYRYVGAEGTILLELFDSSFGLHTAALSRAAEDRARECPMLTREPVMVVGQQRIALESGELPEIGGFEHTRTAAGERLERRWGAGRYWRAITVEIERDDSGPRALRVQNWSEPY